MLKAYKVRLETNNQQETALSHRVGVYRGIICKIEILYGKSIFNSAQSYARNLYNFTRYCAVGYNYRLRKQRGDWYRLGKMPKYPGSAGMWKAMHDTEEYKALNDRTANYILRLFDEMMRSWFSNLKRNKDARPPRYAEKAPPLTFEAGRNAKHMGNGTWRFAALSGNLQDRFVFAKIYLPPLTNPESVRSIKLLNDGRCAISYRLLIKPNNNTDIAAIDLGINRIATIAFFNGESILYPGGLLLAKQRYYAKRIAACKPSGYNDNKESKKSSARKDTYYKEWRKQKRLILDNLTNSIIQECRERGVRIIVIGDLKEIRKEKDFGKVMNQKLHAWPFADITNILQYKAEKWGMELKTVSEKYTSRTCAICCHINPPSARVKRGLLVCKQCGIHIHADVNGAFNILKKYLPLHDGAGVVARLRGQPSTGFNQGPGELPSQIIPTFSAKFDLRNYTVALNPCGSVNR